MAPDRSPAGQRQEIFDHQQHKLKTWTSLKMIWCCPKCQGELFEVHEEIRCRSCASRYESIGGIPDLRLPHASWIDFETDRAFARRIVAETKGLRLMELVRFVYGSRSDWGESQINLRTRQVMEQPNRMRTDMKGWLRPIVRSNGIFLDVGCGAGTLLAAAGSEGGRGIGIDVSMVWLVVAKRFIEAWGGDPILAAASAEALPLRGSSVSSVVSLDVIEHVADPRRYLSEIHRVTSRGGYIALSTANRYSLAAEPHVFVWGVGWLPRTFQKKFVERRTGRSYDCTLLLSTNETIRMLRKHTSFRSEVQIPPVPEEEIAHFAPYRAALARLYNRLIYLRCARWLFFYICPAFRIVGRKI